MGRTERTRSRLDGFLLPGGGSAVHGAAAVLISFANKLKLFRFGVFSVSAW